MTNDWIDAKNSDAILVIGANPAENHPAMMNWVNEARDKNGAKLIVVDPRFTRTAATADYYTKLRSGTDIVFLGALINYTIQNKLFNEDYVKYYTNALTLVNADFKGPADLEGYFSGYNADTKVYDRKTWGYQTESRTVSMAQKDPQTGASTTVDKQVSVPLQASSFDDPNSVFAHLANHYARYTPEMVERICGTPQADFLEVAKAYCATGAPDKTGGIFYAMGQTQHTVGTQNVRAIAMLQLLLGNIGVPGGGVQALRGESNVQGSTDVGLLYNTLPAYLDLPSQSEPDLATYSAKSKYNKTSYWGNGPAFFKSMMKAWFGAAATAENDFAYDYLPKTSGNYSHINLFEAMYAGKIKGLVCMGQNPAVGGPNARLERKALENLDWMVLMELFETETATFWKGPGGQHRRHPDGGLPPARRRRRRESRQHRHQRAAHAVASEGGADARRRARGLWILTQIAKSVKAAYNGSTDAKDRPILDLTWDYGDPPDVEKVAAEINGYALDDVKDSTGKVLVKKGDLLDGYASNRQRRRSRQLRPAACWIYSGYFYPRDDGTGNKLPSVKRRGQDDPSGYGLLPQLGLDLAGEPPHPLQPRFGQARRHALVGEQEGHLVGRDRRHRHQGRLRQPHSRQVGRQRRARLLGDQVAHVQGRLLEDAAQRPVRHRPLHHEL